MRVLLALLLAVTVHGAAFAGPWPRAEGETFLFVGQEVDPDGWTSVYLERGAGRELTFGLSVGGRLAGMAMTDASMPEEARLRVFLRKPIHWRPGIAKHKTASPWLFAAQVAAELDWNDDGTTTPRLALGVTAGRSFQTAMGDGWTSLDLWISGGPGAETRTALQAVVGIKSTPRLTFEIGVFGEISDTTTVTIAPTVQFDLGQRGAARAGIVVDADRAALAVGWMRTF